ncbi:MAG: GNAT family N-acetyltransferase [Novosphingobium sp.]|uniref:GNAT family N-acetyltransferase n=1 Tax=Novosphingobium sp. TaxID=1874826 RepID=UPI0032BCFB0E
MASTALAPDNRSLRTSAAGVAGGFVMRSAGWTSFEAPETRLAWDALASCVSEPNPFHESWYLLPALRALDPAGTVKLLKFEAGGDLAGILPVRAENRYYRWPIPQLTSWIHGNCFLGHPLVARGLEEPFWRSLLAWADQNTGQALFLHLAHMPLQGPLYQALQKVLAEQGRLGALVHREERAMLAAGATPENYFEASLSGKKRKELRRQFARLSELGEVRFERRHDDAQLAQWIEHFLALEHSGWKGAQGSALASHQATTQMFKEALSGAAAQSRLERLTLTLNAEPIAMLATFLTPPGGYSYKTAFDERYSRYSPGVLLQRENLEVLARPEIAWIDSCAAADHPMIDHIWRERRPVGRLSIAIGGKLRRALFARLVRAELGRNPAGI